MDQIFGIATGFLGWDPEVAMRTPVPQIIVAYEVSYGKQMGYSSRNESQAKDVKESRRPVIRSKLLSFADHFRQKV